MKVEITLGTYENLMSKNLHISAKMKLVVDTAKEIVNHKKLTDEEKVESIMQIIVVYELNI